MPSESRLGQLISSDKSAYPQMAGRIFESALTAAIKDDKSMDKDAKGGQKTWDFKSEDFAARKEAINAMFGDTEGGILSNTTWVESKYNATGRSYTESMTGKFSNSKRARTCSGNPLLSDANSHRRER